MEGERTTYVVKPSINVQDKLQYIMKAIFSCVKYKCPRH